MTQAQGAAVPRQNPISVRKSTVILAIFLAPLLAAVVLSLLGVTVGARDDWNYLAELGGRELFTLAPDPVSWTYLIVLTKLIGITPLGLRLSGLIVAALTLAVLRRNGVDKRAIGWFAVSVFPLYFAIYFNQLRLAVALFLFFLVATSRLNRAFAVPVAALGHVSFLFLLFPPIVAISPFVVGAFELLDPASLFAFKLASYSEGGPEAMPWYLGWEMVGLALVFLVLKKGIRLPLEMLAVVVGVRFLADNVSLDIGRRILELGLIAYSPVMLFLFRAVRPFQQLTLYYLALGALQLMIVLKSDVIRLG
jgi:hypothetical protein